MKTEYVGFWPRFAGEIIDQVIFFVALIPIIFITTHFATLVMDQTSGFYEKQMREMNRDMVSMMNSGPITYDAQTLREMERGLNQFDKILFQASKMELSASIQFFISTVFGAIFTIMFWIYKSATPGKMVFSAKIVDERTGRQPSYGQFVGRYFAYLVSMIPLGLGFLWVAFDKKKQGWHDKLSGTIVVYERKKFSRNEYPAKTLASKKFSFANEQTRDVPKAVIKKPSFPPPVPKAKFVDTEDDDLRWAPPEYRKKMKNIKK